jgi:hypothetical protein
MTKKKETTKKNSKEVKVEKKVTKKSNEKVEVIKESVKKENKFKKLLKNVGSKLKVFFNHPAPLVIALIILNFFSLLAYKFLLDMDFLLLAD